jgi:excinuclease ABC subunit C
MGWLTIKSNDVPALADLPALPGVYQMFDANGVIIYVGKAKNLKKRVASYFRVKSSDLKTKALMDKVVSIKFTVTNSENDALLLENTLIKQHKPRFNIIFKDDKTYPYLLISQHNYPAMCLYRTKNPVSSKKLGELFGPYPDASAAKAVLQILQKIFKLRNCKDLFFANRSRPCVQYQIHRCKAPCVGNITINDYAKDVKFVKDFLKGKNKKVIQYIKDKMHKSTKELEFEKAAEYRDQINQLEKIFAKQCVANKKSDADVLVVFKEFKYMCVHIMLVRNGQVVNNKSYCKIIVNKFSDKEILESFIEQYYLNFVHEFGVAKTVLVNHDLDRSAWVASVLGEKFACKIKIKRPKMGVAAQWIAMAELNAQHALKMFLLEKNKFGDLFSELQQVLNLKKYPKLIECFDVSHTQGEYTIASCVVLNEQGFSKQQYRTYNIVKGKGDDYYAMEEALRRRYKKRDYPDLLIVDGGKGQLSRAKAILETGKVTILAIAKGVERISGNELFYLANVDEPISIPKNSELMHFLLRIRDEAHRFAITRHRSKRDKARKKSILENIAGIGPKKRQALLKYFGGLQGVKSAGLTELTKVPGITRQLAQQILDFFKLSLS